MGTPDFAVPSLEALPRNGFEVSLVLTQPDRPRGRGRRLVSPPVKRAAQAMGYPVVQPESIRSPAVQEALAREHPDIIVVTAFGQILPKTLLSLPKMGAVNVHASLLPKYRGPAPIQWAIINRETETGVTTMRMDEGLDTGDILMAQTVPILPRETAETLHDRLADAGAALLVGTLRGIADKTVVPVPQDHSAATYAPMLQKKDGRIDWTRPADRIEAFIRGMTPWPGAFTFFRERRIRIFRADALDRPVPSPPGTVVEAFPGELRVAAGTGVLSIRELQEASGKRLPVAAFLRGNDISAGSVFG